MNLLHCLARSGSKSMPYILAKVLHLRIWFTDGFLYLCGIFHFFVTIRTSHNFSPPMIIFSTLLPNFKSSFESGKSTKTDRLYTTRTCFFLLKCITSLRKREKKKTTFFSIRCSTNELTTYFAHWRKEVCKTWMQNQMFSASSWLYRNRTCTLSCNRCSTN